MVKHSNRASDSKRKIARDSSPDVLKKMNSISDATKILANEVRSMSKIFAENQKILISLKNMVDAVGSALEQIQRNARQINVIEEDTQKLFTGLSQVKAHSNLISKVNEQTGRLQEQVNKIREKQESLPDINKVMQNVADSLDSIRNNTKMIMHVSDKTEKIRDELKKVTQLEQNITNLKQEIGTITSKTESLANMSSDIRDVGIELGSLVRKTDSLAIFGTDIRNVGTEFTNFRDNVLGKTKQIDEKISELTELLNRNSSATSEFHKKTHEIHQEIQEIRNITHKTSQNTSREVVGLLRLAEFQSNVRMHSESKYGTLDDLDKMISQTVDMVNLFDRLSIESEKKIPLPQEVKQWSISKIFDCADRWEIRFTDVFRLLVNQLGHDLVKESMRIEQVRDLFGIRAVDEVRHEFGID